MNRSFQFSLKRLLQAVSLACAGLAALRLTFTYLQSVHSSYFPDAAVYFEGLALAGVSFGAGIGVMAKTKRLGRFALGGAIASIAVGLGWLVFRFIAYFVLRW